jgi:hypothetical protein
MRFIRLLGVTVIVYGFSYLMYGTMQFFGMVNYTASRHLVGLNFSIGAISFAIGVGLLLAKEWARVAWLAASTMLLAEHVFFLALFYLTGEIPPLQIMNVILITMLFLIAWSKLTRTSVKQHFH